MSDWFAGLAGGQYAWALIWTVGALVLLLIVLLIVRMVRGMTSGTFVVGGRNRRPRLAVADATAIDNQRRLVLVRRDDVEHLVLIGGPTDIIVEQNIRTTPQRAPAAPGEAARRLPQRAAEPAAPAPAPAPAAPPAQRRAPEAPPPTVHPATPSRSEAPPPAAESAAPQQLDTPPSPRTSAPQQAAPAAPPPAARPEEPPRSHPPDRGESEEFVADFEERPGEAGQQKERPRDETSLDDEMSRLLEELSEERR